MLGTEYVDELEIRSCDYIHTNVEFVRGEDAGILVYGEFFKPIMFLNSRTIAMKLILFL